MNNEEQKIIEAAIAFQRKVQSTLMHYPDPDELIYAKELIDLCEAVKAMNAKKSVE